MNTGNLKVYMEFRHIPPTGQGKRKLICVETIRDIEESEARAWVDEYRQFNRDTIKHYELIFIYKPDEIMIF
jgi:hypothetical protein